MWDMLEDNLPSIFKNSVIEETLLDQKRNKQGGAVEEMSVSMATFNNIGVIFHFSKVWVTVLWLSRRKYF